VSAAVVELAQLKEERERRDRQCPCCGTALTFCVRSDRLQLVGKFVVHIYPECPNGCLGECPGGVS
jgi:hypothetical protein